MFKSSFINIFQRIQNLLRDTPAYEIDDVQRLYLLVRFLTKMRWSVISSTAIQTLSSQQHTDLRQHQH